MEESYSLVFVKEGKPSNVTSLSDKSIPSSIVDICQGIIDSRGVTAQLKQNSSWDGEVAKVVTKHADNLVQLHNGKRISNDPATWKCEKSGDTKNLWLNLSTGYIGGGRKNWDGSGGSGAALEHYKDTGCKYPLSVKLGTITKNGADVYSYDPDEDDLVIDPKLAEHLSHWGINVMKLTKTDKSMSELDIELNMHYDWNKIIDDGCEKTRISGAGFVGLKNIGSSCYLNAVVQVLCSLPELINRYVDSAHVIIASDASSDVASDFMVQMSKLACAVVTDEYAIPPDVLLDPFDSLLEKFSVAPRMFKSVVSRGNEEFSSGRQQDASEYFQYLLNIMKRAERNGIDRIFGKDGNKQSTASFFEFYMEKRVQDIYSGEVKYISNVDVNSVQNLLELRIPLDKATNIKEIEMARVSKKLRIEDELSKSDIDAMKLFVPFEVCMESYFGEERTEMMVNGLMRSVSITNKFMGFPKYLMIKLGRYMIDSKWKQLKIDAKVDMPLSLNLAHLMATGPQAGEVPMSESNISSNESAIADDSMVQQLIQMGLEQYGCTRSVLAVDNASVEQAMEWYFSHESDPGFHEPFDSEITHRRDSYVVNSESLALLTSMGFSEKRVIEALKNTDDNVERAADWLFSHPGNNYSQDLPNSSELGMHPSQEDINGNYELHAIVSHMGKNTDSGHYVCHIKKGDRW